MEESHAYIYSLKPVALVLGCLSALIFCSYFVSYWIEHKDPFAVPTVTHAVGTKTVAHPVSPHKHPYKNALHVSQ